MKINVDPTDRSVQESPPAGNRKRRTARSMTCRGGGGGGSTPYPVRKGMLGYFLSCLGGGVPPIMSGGGGSPILFRGATP